MASDLRIGVAGATGALGTEIINVLNGAPWRPGTLVPLASSATTVSFVEYGEERIAVDDLGGEALEGLDALIVATPADVAVAVLKEAAMVGVPCVDCTAASAMDLAVPLVIPAVNFDRIDAPRGRDVVAIPSADVLMLGTVIHALKQAGICSTATATVMVGATAWGREGAEELSRQVIALFNQGTAPRKVFESGFAFDLLPQIGDVGASGWTAAEVRASLDLARLTEVPVIVSRVGVPTFNAVSATLQLPVPRGTSAEAVERALVDSGVRLPTSAALRDLPRPRRVDGTPHVHAGRVRLAPDGGSVHLWLTMDNLRATATAAVAVCGGLLGDRRTGTEEN